MSGLIQFRNAAEIEDVVHKFESCQFAKGEFTHAHHLAVAAWYLRHLGPEQALARMRVGLLRFTSHLGVTLYHETITRFWLLVTENFLNVADPDAPFSESVNTLIQRYGKGVLFEYYSRNRINSDEASSGWLEPDLQVLSRTDSQHRKLTTGR